MSGRAINRRQALQAAAATTAGLLVTGCGAAGPRAPDPGGSTLRTTWRDVHGTGRLAVAAGEPLRPRTELGPVSPRVATLVTLAHVTDAHVLDAASPARVTFLDRLGAPFQSTFRPHETLTAQVLSGALDAVRALHPDTIVQGGDLIDNAQANELALAHAVLAGGRARPGSGPHGYYGVQSASDADPFYYRPDVDAPRHPGLLRAAVAPFAAAGARRPWLPVLGDHDVLVAGEIVPSARTQSLALGAEAVWDLPRGLTTLSAHLGAGGVNPDGPPAAGLVQRFLDIALAAPKVAVPADPRRRQLAAEEAVAALRAHARSPGSGPWLDYTADLGDHVRLVVLDLARREGGSGGLVHAGQAAFLQAALAGAGSRWVIVAGHQPLTGSEGGESLLALLDRAPRVLAVLNGHTHRNMILPRRTAAGGYWLIGTASLIDFPQQARALRVWATRDGGAAIATWMLDHAGAGRLGTVARELAYLDAQGGRPGGLAGRRRDRNVVLYRAAPR